MGRALKLKKEIFLTELRRLVIEGKTIAVISSELYCAEETVRRYWPLDLPKRPRGRRSGKDFLLRKLLKFPVHPEVVLAKDELLRTFSANPFRIDDYVLANKRLEAALEKYHPKETRSAKQMMDQG